MSLDGMNAIVTGAASGIGRASAVRLAQDGANVAVLDIDEAGLAETARRVEQAGRRCVPVRVDLLSRDDIRAAFSTVRDGLGVVQILHNNAGGSLRDDIRTFPKSNDEQWDYMVTLNLRQAVDCARAQGAAIVAVTDSVASPIAIGARHVFCVPTETTQFFTSTVALAALLETLMAFVVADAPVEVVESIERFHRRRHDLGVYWDEEAPT